VPPAVALLPPWLTSYKKVLVTSNVGPQLVELRLAGVFGVVRDGVTLPDGELGSRKARTLLKLLAVERRGVVSVDRIVEVLWPDDPPAASRQNVATLVSRLRSTLGAPVILGGPQGYRLAGEPLVSVDLDTASRLCDQAEPKLASAPGVALASAERALDLLSASAALADEPYVTWADSARAELRDQVRRARLIAAHGALSAGNPGSAGRHAAAAMAADPYDESAHRLYMKAQAASGESAKALAAYAALSERLREDLGADPAPATQALHLAILRAEQPELPARADEQPGRWRPPARHHQPLTGRDTEVAKLLETWARAADGTAALVLITGEAGIGKTTLAEAVAAEASANGATVLRTRCYEAERSLFLQPILDAIEPVLTAMTATSARLLLGEHAQAMASLVPEAAGLLGAGAPWRGSPEMERRRAFEAVTAFLAGLAASNPILLVVDDLHHAGQSSVELIHFLSRHAVGSRLLVLVTVRAEHDTLITALAPVAEQIKLGPLDTTAVEQLARQAGQAQLTARIMERTRGHTLFVVEVLRMLAAGDDGLPESLRNAVVARVRRTGSASETLLRAAAVLGAAADPRVLAALLDIAEVTAVELCSAAIDARLLIASGRDYEFANDLIREVLYATTPEPARLAYHRRAADLLTDQPEALARHAAEAGDSRRASRAWLLAAENAMRRHAASDAAALATEALDAAERNADLEVAARALLVRGRARQAIGDEDTAIADLTGAIATARSASDARLEMLALLGPEHPTSRGLPISIHAANLEAGLKIAESLGDRASEAQLLSRLAVIDSNRLRLDAALERGVRALAAGRAANDDQALAAGLDGLKTAHLYAGNVAGLRGVLSELDPLARRIGDLFRLQWAEFEAAFLFVASADWDAATAGMQSALATNQRGGYPHCAAWYTAHLGWIARLRGKDAEAADLGSQALRLANQHGTSWFQAGASAILGRTLELTGDRVAAIALFEEGLASAQASGVEAYLLRCAAPLAAATGSADVLAEATALLGAAIMPAGGAWMPDYESYLSVASAWLERDEPERARATLAPLLSVAKREPWISAHAAALAADGRALARMSQPAGARTALSTAAHLAAKHGLPHVLTEARAAAADLS